MTLRSRPGLVSLRSRPEMDVATWLGWRHEVWSRDQGFSVGTRPFCEGNRGWSRPGLKVTTWLGWARGRDIIFKVATWVVVGEVTT